MRDDGITRLYYYQRSTNRVRQAWPQYEADWITGEEAEQILESYDFVCVSVVGKQSYWNVHPGAKMEDDYFEVDYLDSYLGDSSVNYFNLAARLEEHSHKKGLTILIC